MAWLKALPIYQDTMRKLHRLRERLGVVAKKLKTLWGEKRSDWKKRFDRLYLKIRKAMGRGGKE